MPSTSPGRSRPTSSAFDSLEQEAYLQLWRTYDRLREIDERVFQRHGITAQQYNALRILKSVRPGTLSTSAVGARLVSRAADMTRLLDKLEEQGFVTRQRCTENRRVVYVSITAAGIAVVDRLAADVKRLGKDQLGHLDRTTLRTLIDILAQARGPHEDPAAVAAWPGSRQPKRRVES
jgi:DNA-binding MarR family transcriptional regulator